MRYGKYSNRHDTRRPTYFCAERIHTDTLQAKENRSRSSVCNCTPRKALERKTNIENHLRRSCVSMCVCVEWCTAIEHRFYVGWNQHIRKPYGEFLVFFFRQHCVCAVGEGEHGLTRWNMYRIDGWCVLSTRLRIIISSLSFYRPHEWQKLVHTLSMWITVGRLSRKRSNSPCDCRGLEAFLNEIKICWGVDVYLSRSQHDVSIRMLGISLWIHTDFGYWRRVNDASVKELSIKQDYLHF